MVKPKNTEKVIKLGTPPYTDGNEATPHYKDLVPEGTNKPVTKPTPPDAMPMDSGSRKAPEITSAKLKDMDQFRVKPDGTPLVTNLGVKVADNQNTLTAGTRGPSLFEDFHFHEKLAHFGRERIPERVVHARGSGAHGYFQVYKSLEKYTKAAFLCNPKAKTPVFVRFSTVQGFRGSPDTVRDVRGFATKFYTEEGNFDIVGINTPQFFIQDAIKFPDFVHAVKPEPHNEVPQGQTAHDNFWDFVSLQPEALNNVMWAMSDRGIPRSYRTMEGFGVHTFRLVSSKNETCFVRFHWKPLYGKTSLIWDEAQVLTGRDPDFHRKDLWQAIEAGDYPEYELGLQIISEEDANNLGFDILDASKLIPEALVPVERVGKMTLNRNPDNFFAETEQVAFCPANIVPGVDFSEDPMLQGRVFSYRDTQMYRLGGPNFTELPINRPVCPVTNHQRDGFHRMQIDVGSANYEPNSTGENWPRETPPSEKGGGFTTVKIPVSGYKVRERSETYADYYSQPRLFWLSQTEPEQQHITNAFSFELGKVMRTYIRERIVDHLTRIDTDLAKGVAQNLGITLTEDQLSRNLEPSIYGLKSDASLSLYAEGNQVLKGRKVAILVADGVNDKTVEMMQSALSAQGIHAELLAPHAGMVTTEGGKQLKANGTISGNPSVLFDAVLIPDGASCLKELSEDGDAKYYIRQAYKHLKAIGFMHSAKDSIKEAGLPLDTEDEGIVCEKTAKELMDSFIRAMSSHRVWKREPKTKCFAA